MTSRLEGSSAVEEGAREGTFGFTTKTVTPNIGDAVDFVNTACGVTDAAEGVAYDITGGCAGLGAYPVADCPADYDIVKLNEDGTELSFGARPADNNMCTPRDRPTTFEGGATVSLVTYAFEASDLVGTWVGPCFPSPSGDGSYNQLTFEMTETTWDLDYVAHGNEDCTFRSSTVNIAGDFGSRAARPSKRVPAKARSASPPRRSRPTLATRWTS